jgi:hypothetical protein
MPGAMPPLPIMPSWHGVQLKHRDLSPNYIIIAQKIVFHDYMNLKILIKHSWSNVFVFNFISGTHLQQMKINAVCTGKVNVKMSLCLTKHHAMKTY